MAATSTVNSFLFHFESATAKPTGLTGGTKLMDIKSYPDLGGAPETIETTTLSDSFQTSVNGVQSVDAFDFNANYEKAVYRKLKGVEKKGDGQWFAVVLGADESGTPDGHDGIIVWSGGLTAYIAGGEVNAVREMHAVISVGTAPELLADSSTG
jgi:hypothetical protein